MPVLVISKFEQVPIRIEFPMPMQNLSVVSIWISFSTFKGTQLQNENSDLAAIKICLRFNAYPDYLQVS